MFPIVLMIIIIICLAWDFPGGPTGFATYISLWLKTKKDALSSVLLKRGFINLSYDKRFAYEPCHPRLRKQQPEAPSPLFRA